MFLDLKDLPKGIEFPFVTDIFTFDVMQEFIRSKLHFVDYLVKRAAAGRGVSASHELIVLAWYLKRNLHINENEFVILSDDVLVELDHKFAVRRVGLSGDPEIKGQLTRYEGTITGRILDRIEETDNATIFPVAEFLLSIDDVAANTLERSLQKIVDAARKDLRAHDFSMAISGGAGITIYAAPLIDKKLADQLSRHCERRKYIEQAHSWYGIGIDTNSLVQCVIGHEYAYKADLALEAETRDMKVYGAINNLVSGRKIRVNEPCPCGSGKKYKKCHRDMIEMSKRGSPN